MDRRFVRRRRIGNHRAPGLRLFLTVASLTAVGAAAGSMWVTYCITSRPPPAIHVRIVQQTVEVPTPTPTEPSVVAPVEPPVCTCPEPSEPTEAPEDADPCEGGFLGDPWVAAPEPTSATPGFDGVAVSRGTAGVIAAWTYSQLLVSRDDGRTFISVAEWPEEQSGVIRDVVVGRSGTVFALRGNEVHIFRANETHVVRTVSCTEPLEDDVEPSQLVVGGGYIGVVLPWCGDERPILALSRDYGRTWLRRRLPEYVEEITHTTIRPGGVIDFIAVIPDCMHTYNERYRGHVRGAWWRPIADTLGDGSGMGHDGTTYEVRDGWDSEESCLPDGRTGLCSIDTEGRRRAVLIEDEGDVQLLVAHNGARTYALYGGKFLRLRGARHEVLAEDVPDTLETLTVDSCHRAVALDAGRIARWSPDAGWRIIRERP